MAEAKKVEGEKTRRVIVHNKTMRILHYCKTVRQENDPSRPVMHKTVSVMPGVNELFADEWFDKWTESHVYKHLENEGDIEVLETKDGRIGSSIAGLSVSSARDLILDCFDPQLLESWRTGLGGVEPKKREQIEAFIKRQLDKLAKELAPPPASERTAFAKRNIPAIHDGV